MKTIAIVSQKGGNGKTTTAAALGNILRMKGNRILFVDLDSQGNLTYSLGGKFGGTSIAQVMQIPGTKVAQAIQKTEQGDLLVSAPTLAAADLLLTQKKDWQTALRSALEPVQNDYDYCIIDTPPTVGALTLNALTAADIAITPAQADVYSVTGINQLYTTIDTIKRGQNPGLILKGIVFTRFNPRTTVSKQLQDHVAQAAEKNGTKLFKTFIRECNAVKEAAIMQQSIFDYSPRCNAAKDYEALLEEILED